MRQNVERRGRSRRQLLARIARSLSGLAVAVLACAGPPPRAPNPTQPLEERRAVRIIMEAFREENARAAGARRVLLRPGKLLDVDVTAAGKLYGVAYVTARERHTLGDVLPRPQPGMEEALQLTRGMGKDSEAKILILHDTNYMYDDQVGTNHEATILIAERKLARDVRDFIVRAHAERWP